MSPAAIPLAHAHRLLNHGPTVLVSSAHGGRRNVMAAAWNMPLDFDPPKVAVVIDKSTFTRELIEASGEFVLAVPSRAIAGRCWRWARAPGQGGRQVRGAGAGGLAGRSGGGAAAGGLHRLAGICRVIPEPHIQQAYDLFLGEVLAAWADPAVFNDGRWHLVSRASAASTTWPVERSSPPAKHST